MAIDAATTRTASSKSPSSATVAAISSSSKSLGTTTGPLYSNGDSSMSSSATSQQPSSLFTGILSFLRNIFAKQPTTLGTVWEGNDDAGKAYKDGALRSVGGGAGPIRVAFRNASSFPLILCWVAENGSLYHYYKLKPLSTSSIIEPPQSMMSAMVRSDDHIETTCAGHAFCFAYIEDEDLFEQTTKSKSLPKNDDPCQYIVGGYCPRSMVDDETAHNDGDSERNPIHLVTISQQEEK